MKTFKNILYKGPAVVRIDESQIPYIIFTSDLHLYHKNILYFTQRLSFDGISDIDTMFTVFTDNINNAINNKFPDVDKSNIILFNCGDLIFGSKSNTYNRYIEFKDKLLPITVYNIIGNHDINNIIRSCELVDNPVETWMWNNTYLLEIYRGDQCIAIFTISHQPMLDFTGSINIHGHLHTIEDLENYKGSDKEFAIQLRKDGQHIDVGVDRWYGQPVWLSDILENKTDIQIDKIPQLQSMKWQYKKQ